MVLFNVWELICVEIELVQIFQLIKLDFVIFDLEILIEKGQLKFKVRFFSLFILSFFYFNVEYCGIGVGKLLYIKDELCFFDLRNISFLSLDGVFVLLLI